MNHQYLLNFIQNFYCPDADARQKMTDIYNEMYGEGCTESDIELVMAQTIYNGLEYGNWPWIEVKAK